MPFRRQRSRSFRSGRPARGVDWGGADYAAQLTSAQLGFSWVLSPGDVRTLFTDPTLVRTRLIVTARILTLAPAAATPTALAVGIVRYVGDPDGSGLPTSAGVVPTPYTDPEADWVIHQVLTVAPGAPASTLVTSFAGDDYIWSRAMRRLGNDSGLLLVVEPAGVTWDFNINVRYAIKE